MATEYGKGEREREERGRRREERKNNPFSLSSR
jgi:hypothetical protein